MDGNMFKSLEVENIQSHIHSFMEFHKDVNVITGLSDSGKSSLIRTLRMISQNRPSANFLIRHGCKSASGTIVIEEGEVTRYKTKSENGYKFDGDTFKAIRTDVPDEIRNVLDVSEVNLQSQHDPYFLLTETPGQVAKKFNKLANLEIMDEMLKLVNSKVKDTNRKYDESKQNEETLTENIELLKWINNAQDEADDLQAIQTDMEYISDNIQTLQTTIKRIEELKKEIKEIGDFTDIEIEVDSLLEMQKDIIQLKKDISNVKLLISNIERIEKNLIKSKSKIKQDKKEYNDLMEELGMCPLCERPWK